jgi:hypothetical protein
MGPSGIDMKINRKYLTIILCLFVLVDAAPVAHGRSELDSSIQGQSTAQPQSVMQESAGKESIVRQANEACHMTSASEATCVPIGCGSEPKEKRCTRSVEVPPPASFKGGLWIPDYRCVEESDNPEHTTWASCKSNSLQKCIANQRANAQCLEKETARFARSAKINSAGGKTAGTGSAKDQATLKPADSDAIKPPLNRARPNKKPATGSSPTTAAEVSNSKQRGSDGRAPLTLSQKRELYSKLPEERKAVLRELQAHIQANSVDQIRMRAVKDYLRRKQERDQVQASNRNVPIVTAAPTKKKEEDKAGSLATITSDRRQLHTYMLNVGYSSWGNDLSKENALADLESARTKETKLRLQNATKYVLQSRGIPQCHQSSGRRESYWTCKGVDVYSVSSYVPQKGR